MNVCMICVFPRHSQLHVVEEATETRQMCSAKSGTIVQGKIVCLSGWLGVWLSGWLDVSLQSIVLLLYVETISLKSAHMKE